MAGDQGVICNLSLQYSVMSVQPLTSLIFLDNVCIESNAQCRLRDFLQLQKD